MEGQMISNVQRPIPFPIIQRLPRYLSYAKALAGKGITWVSSQTIGRDLNLTSSTVRKDFSYLDYNGRSRNGYRVRYLVLHLTRFLGIEGTSNTVIVGAGLLGQALARHQGFIAEHYKICGIFDSRREVIGLKLGSLTVEDISLLPLAVAEWKAALAILTEPGTEVQARADLLAAAGIKGILNFTSRPIGNAGDIMVKDISIVECLEELSCLLKIYHPFWQSDRPQLVA